MEDYSIENQEQEIAGEDSSSLGEIEVCNMQALDNKCSDTVSVYVESEVIFSTPDMFLKTNENGDISSYLENYVLEQSQKNCSIERLNLVFYPLRSMKNIFLWITCPKKLKEIGEDFISEEEISSLKENEILVSDRNSCVIEGLVYFENFTFIPKISKNLSQNLERLAKNVISGDESYQWWRNKFSIDVVVVEDKLFEELVYITINNIPNDYVTKSGKKSLSLYSLPSESIFCSKKSENITKSSKEDKIVFVGESMENARGICRVCNL